MEAPNWRNKVLALALAGVVLALVLNGCSPAGSPSDASSDPPAATAGEDPRVGGTAVLALAGEPDTLDVHLSTHGAAGAAWNLIGASLLAQDPYNGDIVPYLAESWEVADGGKQLTFVLKDGIEFHDGSPLTAEDYAWTINRALAPETASAATGAILSAIVQAEAIDSRTLVLTLTQPNFVILEGLTLPQTSPYSKAYVEAHGFDHLARNPMSVGPYVFKEWKTGESLVFERNPRFTWGPAHAPGPRFVERVEYRVIAETATSLAALESGEIVANGVPNTELDRFRDPERFTLYRSMSKSLYPAMAFNLDKAPWNDLTMRQALSYAIDRQKLVEVVFQGEGLPAYGPLPPSISGYDPLVESYYNYDEDKALELFAQAGWKRDASSGKLVRAGRPLEFTVLAPAIDQILSALEVLQQMLKESGISMNIQAQDINLIGEKVQAGEFEVTLAGYNYPFADILYLSFHSSLAGGGLNAGVRDPELDVLLEASRSIMDDPERRQQALSDAQRRIVEQAYWVTLVNGYGTGAVSTTVQDSFWSDALGELNLDLAWLKEE